MINTFILVTAVLIVVSKFFDCYTTVVAAKMGINENGERNPLARFLMKKFGFRTTIWSVFAYAVIFSVLIAFIAFVVNNIYFSLGFIILGLILSLMQFDVARSNYFGRQTFFTRLLPRIYNKFNVYF